MKKPHLATRGSLCGGHRKDGKARRENKAEEERGGPGTHATAFRAGAERGQGRSYFNKEGGNFPASTLNSASTDLAVERRGRTPKRPSRRYGRKKSGAFGSYPVEGNPRSATLGGSCIGWVATEVCLLFLETRPEERGRREAKVGNKEREHHLRKITTAPSKQKS